MWGQRVLTTAPVSSTSPSRPSIPRLRSSSPISVHYELQLHTGQGWKGIAYGLITDFDATEDEVVFYGQDYLGLLARTVEERFSTADAELSTDKGGGKYVEKTIKDIIFDQLSKEKAKANSPVGFINVNTGDIASHARKATIYASFKQRLPFISGPHRQQPGRDRTAHSLVPERNAAGVWSWRVICQPRTRPPQPPARVRRHWCRASGPSRSATGVRRSMRLAAP